jgi:hypothetical protein
MSRRGLSRVGNAWGADGATISSRPGPDLRRRRPGRVLYSIAFVVLLADGAAAIWLGQVGGRVALVVLGACLVLGSLGVGVLYRRWQAALNEVDLARRALREEVEALRRAVHDVPRGPGRREHLRRRVASEGGDSGAAGGAKASSQLDEHLRRRVASPSGDSGAAGGAKAASQLDEHLRRRN